MDRLAGSGAGEVKRSRVLLAALVTVALVAPLFGALGERPAHAATSVSPQSAVDRATAEASYRGVYSFVSVIDRATGQVVAQTGNAGYQVASESLMKLYLAAYYLRIYGGHASTPQGVKDRLAYMLRYSDDNTASALFTSAAIPTIAGVYGLRGSSNAYGNPGYWGAARVTATDSARLLQRASADPLVGPWLIPALANTAAYGSGADAGFFQGYGLNALSGVHGSKQGWGCDSYWTAPSCAIHSVGYTDAYFVAVLQLAASYPDPMRWTATNTASQVQSSRVSPQEGDFIHDARTGTVYRLVGGAPLPVADWKWFGGAQAFREVTPSVFDALRASPSDGVFVRDPSNGAVYKTAGGAPVYVSDWRAVGGARPFLDVDPAVFANAGGLGAWGRLRLRPVDGTFLRAPDSGAVFVVAGGSPLYVSDWGAVGGVRPFVDVDPVAIRAAGSQGVYRFLRGKPADGTFVRDFRTQAVFQVVAGAPLYVTSWAPFGGVKATTFVDGVAVANGGGGWPFHTLLSRPPEGTLLRAWPTGAQYRVDGTGRAVRSDAPVPAGARMFSVNQETIDRAGTGPWYLHLSP